MQMRQQNLRIIHHIVGGEAQTQNNHNSHVHF